MILTDGLNGTLNTTLGEDIQMIQDRSKGGTISVVLMVDGEEPFTKRFMLPAIGMCHREYSKASYIGDIR
jgi:hypothetical protein